MVSRGKLLVAVFFFVFFAASVEPLPSGDATESTDEDATIQTNPNYTEPIEKVVDGDEDLAEKKEKGNEMAKDVAVDEKGVTEKHVESDMGEKDGNKAEQDNNDDENDDEEDEYDGDDEYDEEENEDEESKHTVKRMLAQALSKSRTAPRRTLKFVKKNRVKLTIAAALFAFRKEIMQIAYLILTKPKTIDPETGRVLSRTLNISPTAVLKVLLFIDLMRKLNSGDVSGQDTFGSQGSFLLKLLHHGNTAYVPPVEQHWTFERVNERYDKDKMAYQKAITPGAGLSLHKKDMAESLRSFASSAILGNTAQAQKDDLVIILDWTKLTESVDQMNSLRDQVSFILSQHRAKNDMLSMAPISNTTNVTVAETTEIIVILESPGGAAADYGLAAQMMLRLSHEPGLVVTVCVDKVAASGGYMIACASSPGRLYGMLDSSCWFHSSLTHSSHPNGYSRSIFGAWEYRSSRKCHQHK